MNDTPYWQVATNAKTYSAEGSKLQYNCSSSELCEDLVGHDDGLQREVLPVLEAEASRLESGKRAVRRAEDAIAVW